MNTEARDYWQRAQKAIQTASTLADVDPDAAASRAHYAAFYAVSALFANEGRSFQKHAALEAAVHRDLVRSGRWSAELGAGFSWLVTMRSTADYGGGTHATAADATMAVNKVGNILDAVRQALSEAPPD